MLVALYIMSFERNGRLVCAVLIRQEIVSLHAPPQAKITVKAGVPIQATLKLDILFRQYLIAHSRFMVNFPLSR